MRYPARLAHLATRAVVVAKLAPTFAEAHHIDHEEADIPGGCDPSSKQCFDHRPVGRLIELCRALLAHHVHTDTTTQANAGLRQQRAPREVEGAILHHHIDLRHYNFGSHAPIFLPWQGGARR